MSRRSRVIMLMLTLVFALQTSLASAAADDPRLYVVGPSDVLTINVYNQPQLSGKFPVEADGTLMFPLVGRVLVAGLSVRAIEDAMRDRLARGYLRDPQVTVAVDLVRSQQVFVMGEVRNPGPLPLPGPMSLIEALGRVGSITDRAGVEALIIRSPEGSVPRDAPAAEPKDIDESDVMRVDLESLQKGAVSQNVMLMAGDTVWVPRAESVFVSGHVRTPGEFVIRKTTTVRQALALAGGVSERGSTRRIQIIRKVNGVEVTIGVSLQDLVRAGDTIVVRERFF